MDRREMDSPDHNLNTNLVTCPGRGARRHECGDLSPVCQGARHRSERGDAQTVSASNAVPTPTLFPTPTTTSTDGDADAGGCFGGQQRVVELIGARTSCPAQTSTGEEAMRGTQRLLHTAEPMTRSGRGHTTDEGGTVTRPCASKPATPVERTGARSNIASCVARGAGAGGAEAGGGGDTEGGNGGGGAGGWEGVSD